jgi:hypothetical protein
MVKHWMNEPAVSLRAAPEGKVWVRFTVDCLHTGLPFKAGDEIMVDDHWADSIEAIGSGHRITTTPKEN